MLRSHSTSSAALGAYASCAVTLGSLTRLALAAAEANALRDTNVPKPGAAMQDPQAFGPVNDLSGAVFADQMPHVDPTGQVTLEVTAKWAAVRAPPGAALGVPGEVEVGQGGKSSEGTVGRPDSQAASESNQYSAYFLTLLAILIFGAGYFVRGRLLQRRQNTPVAPNRVPPKTGAQPRLDSGFIHTESGL